MGSTQALDDINEIPIKDIVVLNNTINMKPLEGIGKESLKQNLETLGREDTVKTQRGSIAIKKDSILADYNASKNSYVDPRDL